MAKPNFSILLPPAAGKATGGNPFAPDMFDYRSSTTFNFFNELNQQRRQVIEAMHDAIEKGDELEKIFKVKGDTLEEALQINAEIYSAPLMSALDRYGPGVMYESMDFPGLPTGAQRRLLENGVILSGLFGLLRPDDLIANYRLPMNATLPGIGKLSTYWKPHISPVLNHAVEDRFVWNFLSRQYERAWDDERTYEQIVDVRFYKEEDGERTAVTHGVKPLRGQLINHIVQESVEDMETFREWKHPEGYFLDEEASSYDEEKRERTLVMVKGSEQLEAEFLARQEEENGG